ncbi:MAG: carbohydrate kinase family protein, partial [bacterium]|nr:carbohydrate kinase family protein [bacterium]
MFDVITFGSATRDAFARSPAFRVLKYPRFPAGKALALPLGVKLDVEEFTVTVGGGAVNTAATFANQGLRTAALCVVGKDAGGREVEEFFKERRISRDFLFVDSHENTAYSFILSAGKKDRTILQRNGAEWHLSEFPIPYSKLAKAKWWYVNHIGGKAASLVPRLLKTAAQEGVFVAWNPGNTQLKLKKGILPLLSGVDVFIVNQEEASLVTGVPYKNRERMFRV